MVESDDRYGGAVWQRFDLFLRNFPETVNVRRAHSRTVVGATAGTPQTGRARYLPPRTHRHKPPTSRREADGFSASTQRGVRAPVAPPPSRPGCRNRGESNKSAEERCRAPRAPSRGSASRTARERSSRRWRWRYRGAAYGSRARRDAGKLPVPVHRQLDARVGAILGLVVAANNAQREVILHADDPKLVDAVPTAIDATVQAILHEMSSTPGGSAAMSTENQEATYATPDASSGSEGDAEGAGASSSSPAEVSSTGGGGGDGSQMTRTESVAKMRAAAADKKRREAENRAALAERNLAAAEKEVAELRARLANSGGATAGATSSARSRRTSRWRSSKRSSGTSLRAARQGHRATRRGVRTGAAGIGAGASRRGG